MLLHRAALAVAATLTLSTALACRPTVSISVSCERDGVTHEVGETTDDGCNTCTCLEDGTMACTDADCSEPRCSHEGYFHQVGDTWQSFNQCEECTCGSDGQAVCASSGPCETCFYAGVFRENGDTFPARDGCNTCSCAAGSVACTKIACACDPDEDWWRYYGDLGSCTIDFDCHESKTHFENECGCGCEQASWCFEVFDCKPPKACDPDQIAELCPTSKMAF